MAGRYWVRALNTFNHSFIYLLPSSSSSLSLSLSSLVCFVFCFFFVHFSFLFLGVFLRWKHVRSRVIHWNICASNGIIHVIDKFLFTTSEPTSSTPFFTTTRRTIPFSDDIIGADSKGNVHTTKHYLMCFTFSVFVLWLGV